VRTFLLLSFFLLAGCDKRRSLCDDAVDLAMKGKPSFKILEVISDEDERPVEGKGISQYKYIYRYYAGQANLVVSASQCIYGDGDGKVEIYGTKEFEVP